MSFHRSASDIELDNGHILRAKLTNANGDEVDAYIDLNTVIGNSDGSFEWGGENFAASADDISFELEGDDDLPILRAELGNIDGEKVPATLNLAERLGNNDGSFHFE